MNYSPRKAGTEKEIPMNNAHRLDHILDSDRPTDSQRLAALVEELGEVARALTYDASTEAGHGGDLATEVTQVGALAAAWALHVLETAEVETIDVGRAL